MLETSSWGECGNDDLPGNQASFDRSSLYFDTDRLSKDFDSFGYAIVTLNLSADRPIAALAIRLCETSPKTGASHLVSYRFYNLAYRGGDMAKPERIEPGVPFTLRVPLNLMGHTFKKGWRIRLALSPNAVGKPGGCDYHARDRRGRRPTGKRADPPGARSKTRGSTAARFAAEQVGWRLRQS